MLKPKAFQGVTDPGRITAQIVTGIGFLGTGTIIKDGLSVRGLTTAACLWVTCAIGMVAGAGLYILSFITTAIAPFSLAVLHYVEKFHKKDIYPNLTLCLPVGEKPGRAEEVMKEDGFKLTSSELLKNYDSAPPASPSDVSSPTRPTWSNARYYFSPGREPYFLKLGEVVQNITRAAAKATRF
ncbi:hypothetical protein DSLASN_10190 [Desulfoluna limicola]|uniref:MgtC/SapB/SrpB/YhiD N-terminal domain-containing protein n=1 Tax=Desulfoluna limicola TaxID=2810562 RepID=A0ABM7PCK9_9BACT|nr:MgtC/SapB family protein [Desulfoluna limicola]BCS95387.1 hypothetical protein DSLASN_10190 [Desulfoluna limicola]